jgi:hypothetical protein
MTLLSNTKVWMQHTNCFDIRSTDYDLLRQSLRRKAEALQVICRASHVRRIDIAQTLIAKCKQKWSKYRHRYEER